MRMEAVACPKPRRISSGQDQPVRPFRWQFGLSFHNGSQTEMNDLKAGSEILDIIMTKVGCGVEQNCSQIVSSPPVFCGSPPTRVANPLIKDERFREENLFAPLSPLSPDSPHLPSSPRKGAFVRSSFGNKPSVRIEGFDCLSRDGRNCGVPAWA